MQHKPVLHKPVLLHDYLIASARRSPGKVALIFGEERLTYGEMDRISDALASALVSSGIRRGDRVMILAENGVEAASAFWAALKANAVACVVSPLSKPEKLSYYLRDTRATALIVQASLLGAAETAIEASGHLRATMVCGDIDEYRTVRLPGFISFANAANAPASAAAPPVRTAIDADLAAIIYTSGSTGDPKGVMLTHRNMLTAADSIMAYLEMAEDDVILGMLPLAFDYGLYQMIMAFASGAQLLLEKSFALPQQVLARAAKHGVTVFPGVPTVFAMIARLDAQSGPDLSAVRCITSSGAAVSEKHLRAIEKAFPSARIYSMYGLTECKRCSYLPPSDLHRKPGSVGIAIPNTELWLVDDQGNRLGPDEVGQLVVRGGTVMRGYWDDPEATAQRLKPGPLPGEWVLYTGDLFRLDGEGYLYFVSRMDDVIKSRGEKVAPWEVENALLRVAGVSEAAVIGVPDDILGQAIKAFVITDGTSTINAEYLLQVCRENLEPHLVPRQLELVTNLPRNANGKIDKTALA